MLADAGRGGTSNARRTKRIMVEAPDLGTSLPLSLSSSIFVRVDSSRMHLWKALVTGPEETPYGCGCFVFDLHLPAEYPQAPPKVLLTTTGGGQVRFNPNLYADGKVGAQGTAHRPPTAQRSRTRAALASHPRSARGHAQRTRVPP
jgi:baculoviral IAP repeat-containing protein 6